MEKELVVSSSSHETKVAILEDNQVVEAYFEREKEYSLAGSIYKGRVTRVLPGMQSAFVDVGLERDAFLYVSDFFEDVEEYDKIVTSVEEKVIKMEEGTLVAAVPVEAPEAPVQEEKSEAVAPVEAGAAERAIQQRPERPERSERPERVPPSGNEPYSRRSRRRRPHRKGFPDSKYSRQRDAGPPPRPERAGPERVGPDIAAPPTILPGESLAKYRGLGTPADIPPPEEPRPGIAEGLPADWKPSESGFAVEESSFRESIEPQAGMNVSEPAPAPAAVLELPAPPASWSAAPAWEDLDKAPAAELAVPEETAIQEMKKAEPYLLEPVSQAPTLPQESFEVPRITFATHEASTLREQGDQSVAKQPFEPPAQAFEEQAAEPAALEAAMEEPLAVREAYFEESPIWEAEPAAMPPEEGPEGRTAEPAAAASAAPEAPAEESARPTQAVLRDSHRNPRYQRKSRWGARRAAPAEAPPQSTRPRERVSAAPQIADLLKAGQEIIVQIAKEPLGKKGARITSHIALPGRYLVYMPTVSHVGVSHKIGSDEERQRLKRIIQEHGRNFPGGFIVRTAGEGRSEAELRQDILFLANMWADIRAKAEKAKAPALLHHDLSLVQRIIRDQLSHEFTAVWVDNEEEYERLMQWVSRFQPSLVGRVKLYTKDVPLFDQMGIQDEINKALKPKVWLKSGGYIVINQTEALVAIDVNTGKFVGKSSRLEDTIFKTNVDAIQEIVRQIRLRDLGGIIVVDFIDMDERKNRHKVMAALEDALRADRSPSKMLSFNEFGLVAITRKRVRQSLERTLGEPCPYCSGAGLVKSPATVCCEIYTEARKLLSELQGRQVTLRVNPEVGKALKARDNTILSEIEEMIGKPVVVRNDPSVHIESFAFE
ncbi:MAG: Rne/Rng family ribonuclease [Terriglobia bacterium]